MKPFYKTILLLFLNSLFLEFNSFSQQAPGIEWQNTIGGINYDALTCGIPASDGGFLIGGFSNSGISGDKTEASIWGSYDYWIVKLDHFGIIQWQNTIGGNSDEALYCVEQTPDHEYILAGNSSSGISGDKTENNLGADDYWIIKIDTTGFIQWQNTIGGSAQDQCRAIRQTTDGGYVMCGASTSNISGDKTENSFNNSSDIWIVKLDSSGGIQWQNTIGGTLNDYAGCINQVSDGGYIVGGSSESDSSGDKAENSIGGYDYWIIKLDSAGNIVWQNTIGGNGNDGLASVWQTSDGGYIAGGNSASDSSGDKTENTYGTNNYPDFWILKLDSAGNIQWQNTIGGDRYDYLNSAQQTFNGCYILGGKSDSDISGDKTENCLGQDDYWIVKTDSAGNILWQNTIGGNVQDNTTCFSQTPDKGYLIGGISNSGISGDKTENNLYFDYWIVKLFPDTITSISNLQIPNSKFQVYPNPSSGIFQINFSKVPNFGKVSFEVINTLGQTVFATQPETRNQKPETTIDVSFLPIGIYVLKINNSVSALSSKFVIE